MPLVLSLIAALVGLGLWITFAFVIPVHSGMVHLLYAAAVVLLVRWIALRDA
jgi:hypothetical protein